jgi:drug/metabolite transporter (DMT)-like permease
MGVAMFLDKSTRFAAAAGIFAILIWSALPVIIKVGLQQLPLTYFLFLRFLLSGVGSWTFVRIRPLHLKKVPLRQWLYLAGLLAA